MFWLRKKVQWSPQLLFPPESGLETPRLWCPRDTTRPDPATSPGRCAQPQSPACFADGMGSAWDDVWSLWRYGYGQQKCQYLSYSKSRQTVQFSLDSVKSKLRDVFSFHNKIMLIWLMIIHEVVIGTVEFLRYEIGLQRFFRLSSNISTYGLMVDTTKNGAPNRGSWIRFALLTLNEIRNQFRQNEWWNYWCWPWYTP